MGGENEPRGSPVQPGGRPPAPGALSVVQAFINSHYDLERVHGAELLASPAGLVEWLAPHDLIEPGMVVSARGLERALTVRECLRTLAAANSSGIVEPAVLKALDEAAGGARAEPRFGGTNGPSFVTGERSGVGGALGVLLGITAIAIADGSWERLKICPGDDCGWAFYDNSRNRTGRWCSMSVCGGRAKARTHYRRLRGGD
jgi:predicted RNA-binding Zn ribbon-like protein